MILATLQSAGFTYRKKTENEHTGACPWCGGKDRFQVWPQQGHHGYYWCRQCGKKGDAIQFLREYKGMSFQEACIEIGKTYNFTGPSRKLRAAVESGGVKKFTPREVRLPESVWQEKARSFVEWAHEHLMKNAERGTRNVIEYLSSRGITLESVKRFRLGWNPGKDGQDLLRRRRDWGLPEEKKCDGKVKNLWLPIGLVIPFYEANTQNSFSLDDVIHSVKIRIPEERRKTLLPPYYVVPGSGNEMFIAPSHLYAPLRRVERDRSAFMVVEAELDAILIFQEAGDKVGVVATGSCSDKPSRRLHPIMKEAVHIGIALDYDLPEVVEMQDVASLLLKNPGGKAWQWWRQNFEQAERWPVPAGKDPGDYYKKGGNIREWVLAGLPPLFMVNCHRTD